VYVLLAEGVQWTAVPGTTAQRPAPVRWYLRQSMPTAATQTVVLIEVSDDDLDRCIAEVARCAESLGGVALDGPTQQVIDPRGARLHH